MPGRARGAVVEFQLQLRVGAEVVDARGEVLDAPVTLRALLPVLHGLSGSILGSLSRQAAAQGREITCGAGCGACCRQPVPVGEDEARALALLVDQMPRARRDAVRARFDAALSRLESAGLLEQVRAFPSLESSEERSRVGREYFRLGIPCPFLEQEACSIHPARPLSCREYLVTSPAAACATLDSARIARLEVPRRLSNVLFRMGDGRGDQPPRWMALVLALEAAPALRRVPEPRYPSRELLGAVVRHLRAPGAPDDVLAPTASPGSDPG
jgi:Fe-S-cluster containining protein